MIPLKRNRLSPAFTLLELLVVISIIVTLLALAIPTLGKMRVMSQNTTNINNLRQLGSATLTFAGEHDGRIPQTLQNIKVGGKSGKGVFQTSGIDLYADGSVRQLFSAANWPDFGTGTTDYLQSVDVLYGPFTPNLNANRSRGRAWEMTPGRFRVGYTFYYIPLVDDSASNPSIGTARIAPNDPDKRPISNALLQTAHPRAPLFCDIISKTFADQTGYPWLTREVVQVVRMDGSVHGIPGQIIRTSTENRIVVLAGYSKYHH